VSASSLASVDDMTVGCCVAFIAVVAVAVVAVVVVTAVVDGGVLSRQSER
jgi:hypothetical protein